MDIETIRTLQAYGYIFFIVFLAVVLYGYIYHLYHTEKTGKRNYEKYSDLVLNDNLNDNVLEARSNENEISNKEVEKWNG